MLKNRSALAIAAALGVIALLPFVAGVWYAYAGGAPAARAWLTGVLAYLATIVAFIGGVQWGRMLAQASAPPLDMVLAVGPALIAWGALLVGAPWRTLLLLFALVVAWLIDEHGARQGWQTRGFLRLRRLLTLVVALAIAAIGWRVARG